MAKGAWPFSSPVPGVDSLWVLCVPQKLPFDI